MQRHSADWKLTGEQLLNRFAFFQQIGPVGMIVILVIALIVFGKRLPEVARSMGKGIVEFKKGLRGVEDEIDHASSGDSKAPAKRDD